MILKKTYYFKWLVTIGIILIILSILVNSPLKEVPIEPKPNNRDKVSEKASKGMTRNALLRDSIVNYGMQLLNTPYVAAGCSKDGFDCSGFVYFVYQHYKIKVPRSSIEFENFGKEIPIEKVKKGDILVFSSPTQNVIGHIGIVVNPKGMESDFIHSSSSKEMKVMVSSLKQDGYTKRFVKAVDVIEK